MDVIITNKNRVDIGTIEAIANIDIDVNKERAVTIQIARNNYDPEFTFGSWVYVPGTEYGGMIDEVSTSTALDYVELRATTCRGKLAKRCIEPPAGETHLVVSGDLHTIMAGLVNNAFDGLIYARTELSGYAVNNYQFDRYQTLLGGIEGILASVSCKLCARIIRTRSQRVCFEIYAEPIVDYSQRIELSNDHAFTFTMKEERCGYNHIIGLGKGEGLERTVVHRYIGQDGTITEAPYYSGYEENTYIYENTNAETADLAKKTEEKLLSVASRQTLGMTATALSNDVKIGDIVGGRDYLTGLKNAKPIENIICKIRDGEPTLTYKLEGET